MKKPKFNPKQYQKLTPSQKLNAMVRRAVQPVLEEREEEPTMRFSTAFIIVFLLQAVAIGGIVVFNQIHKDRQAPQEISAQSRTPETVSNVEDSAPKTVAANHAQKTVAPAPVAVHLQVAQTPPLAVAPSHREGVQDSGTTYVVAKGDVPERIAKKFRVSYDDLLKLNKITNPRRLQIGQKLHIPVAHLAND